MQQICLFRSDCTSLHEGKPVDLLGQLRKSKTSFNAGSSMPSLVDPSRRIKLDVADSWIGVVPPHHRDSFLLCPFDGIERYFWLETLQRYAPQLTTQGVD